MTDGPPHHYPPPGAPPPEESAQAGPPTPPTVGPPAPPAPSAPPYGAPTGAPGATTPPYGAPPAYRPPPAPYPGYGARGPVPGMLGAAHKPGAIPLRPLTLGSIYDGAFRIIRFNPKATVGAAVLVSAVAMLLPVIVTAVVGFTVGSGLDASGEIDDELGTGEALGLIGSLGSLVLGVYAAQLGVIFVTGMIAHVTRAAAVGRRLTLAESWAATYGKRWRLIGQTLVIALVATLAIAFVVLLVVAVALATEDVWLTVLSALVLTPLLICTLVFFGIRAAYLATPALMLEQVGVFGAFGRSWRLTASQFWRTLGIALLTALIGGTAGYVLTLPIGIIGQIGALALPELALTLLVLTQAISLVVQNAFVAPFTAAVSSLQYLDQRMRKEAFDVELMREAGLMPR